MTKKSSLSVFALVMITVGAVDSIRNLPATALFGSKIIAFYLLAALFFLIPCALVSAELSSRYPGEAGVFSWVKRAFGGRWGFMAVWLQWAENAPFFPAILSFIAGAFGYLISPELASNKYYLMTFVICVFWILTFVNILGIRTSAKFSSFCTVAGLFVPMALIICMGVVWLLSGNPMEISMSPKDLMPELNNLSIWVTMQGVILSLCGIELATVHARDTHEPQKSFPKALIISVAVILLTLIMGSLSIAFIVPKVEIENGLVTGVIHAFDLFLVQMNAGYLLPVIGLMLVVGGLGGVNSWIIAPTRGLFFASQEGHMPSIFAKENQNGAPVSLLVMQAVLVSLLMVVFFLIPSVNGAYWLINVLGGQIYALMYMIMFVAAIVLALREPKAESAYRISPKLGGMLGVASFGLVGSTAAFLVCFIPPEDLPIGNPYVYEALLVGCLLAFVLLPFAFKPRKKSHLHDPSFSSKHHDHLSSASHSS